MTRVLEFLGVYFGGRGIQWTLIVRRHAYPHWWCRKPFTHKHAVKWKRSF